MNHHQFDEQVRRAVEQINTEYQPQNWDLLEQRLNELTPAIEETAAEAEERFDSIIREKIQNQRQPQYNPNHWIIMSTILDEYHSVAAWLRRYKVLETVLTVLFIFTFINVFYNPNKIQDKILSKIYPQEKENITTQTNIGFEKNTNGEKPLVYESQSNTNLNSIPTTIFTFEKNRNESKNNIENAFENEVFATKEVNNNATIVVKENNTAQHNITNSSKIKVENTINENIEIPQNEPIVAFDNLPSLPIGFLDEKANKTFLFDRINKKIRRTKHYWSYIAVADINRVQTPDANFFGTYIPEYYQYKLGTGFGFIKGTQLADLAFETGLLYNRKVYAAADVRIEERNNIGSNATREEKLEDIVINGIQIPLQFNVQFLSRKRFGIHSSFGAAANLIMQAKYDKSRTFVGYTIRPLPTLDPEPNAKPQRFEDGFLSDYKLRENAYLSVNAGLGFTYKITPKWSLLSQMQVQYYLVGDGFGPNKDKINTYSTWFGARKNF